LAWQASHQKCQRNLKITFALNFAGAHGNAVSLSKTKKQRDHSRNKSATAPMVVR
jgi:hypothetical protein